MPNRRLHRENSTKKLGLNPFRRTLVPIISNLVALYNVLTCALRAESANLIFAKVLKQLGTNETRQQIRAIIIIAARRL